MNIDEIISQSEQLSDDQLTQMVLNDYDLTQAVLTRHPQMAQDTGFELFDKNWAKRYWRNIVAEIESTDIAEITYKWALKATVTGTASLIITYFDLPQAAAGAAVALAIILVRAAGSTKDAENKK